MDIARSEKIAKHCASLRNKGGSEINQERNQGRSQTQKGSS
jgi:biotin operon repressor